MRTVAVVCLVCLAGTCHAQSTLEQLQQAPPPDFADEHTLLPLSFWGPSFSFEERKELADNWGFCLIFGRLTPKLVEALDDPESDAARTCALAASAPERYPMHVIVAPAFTIRGFVDELPADTWCRDETGELIDGKRVYSPEAPDETFERIAEAEVEMLRPVLDRAPITIITNGGEYALGTIGHHLETWEQDPKVVAAKGDREWFDYISERKAHQEMIVSERIRELVPDRRIYIYYHTEASHHRNRYGGWWRWVWDYDYMRPVSDIPNTSIYYQHYNSGFTGDMDMLVMALNSTTQQIEYDEPLSYNWVTAGWPRENLGDEAIADPERYMGYLKCYYTAGMIGGAAGYFSYEDSEEWVWQLMALGRVHALFSHLEDFLRNGDLLRGPDMHVWSTDLPAREFPTGDDGSRVVARKHRDGDAWLVTAWAASGDAREVTVEIPDLGEVTLNARPGGSVYRAIVEDAAPSLRLIDEDALLPTAGL